MNNFNFFGKNVVIVNGQNVSGGKNIKLKKFDERKSEDCSNIDKIKISSVLANVNVSVCNSSAIEAHFYGEAQIDGDIEFNVKVLRQELIIILEIIGTCLTGKLNLDITIPQKVFKAISITSSSGNINLNKGVSAKQINVSSMSGSLNLNADVNDISAHTMSGDIAICIDAHQFVTTTISTMSGDVSATFNNIGHINLHTKTMSGTVKDNHKTDGCYSAYVEISTMSGNIRIR